MSFDEEKLIREALSATLETASAVSNGKEGFEKRRNFENLISTKQNLSHNSGKGYVERVQIEFIQPQQKQPHKQEQQPQEQHPREPLIPQ